MSRILKLTVSAALVVVVLLSVACQREVTVKTGTRVECAYGHVISDDMHTVRVPTKDAAKYRAKTVYRTCPKHAQAQALYEDAQKDIADGLLGEAQKKLEKVAALYPNFGNTASQLVDLKAKKKPTADDGSDSGSGSGSGGGSTAVPSAKLTAWMPDNLSGFTAKRARIDVFTVTRDYVPADADIVILAIVAEQRRTSTGAKRLLGSMVKGPCPQDADTLTINGRSVYFGTDGGRIAAIGFTEGPVMIGMQMVSKGEGDGKALKSTLIDVAKQLP